ncbi:hypothetical protein O3M35_005057 [Rhynocoris fuscipes]|uniref:Transposase n=1 Tax=Rhynocoris fuscipes TaxID=488301 RepID=A0AAW1DM54_9HEMI
MDGDPLPCSSGKRTGKFILNTQARIFVHRLYNYFNKEYEQGSTLKPVRKVNERIADSLNISRLTVSKVLKETRSGLPIKTPGRKRVRSNPVSGIDPFSECAVRNHIYSYYERKEWPNMFTLLDSLKEAGIYHGEKTALTKILNKIYFKWRKVNNIKRLLENSEIIAARCRFIQNIQQYDMKKMIFVGECNINVSKHFKDGGIVILDAGNAEGFIPNCCLLIKSQDTIDPKQVLNADVFRKWFIHTFLKNIPKNSVIVMDNASNHSTLKEKIPTSFWNKRDIQDWLTKHNVEWSPSMLKGVLLDLVNTHKPLKKRYELDELAQDEGHTVIRLPVKHSEYNPIEMIWAELKAKVGKQNPKIKLNYFEKLIKEAINTITVKDWIRVIEHSENAIEKARIREEIVEKNIEEMLEAEGEEWSCSSQTESESDVADEDEEYIIEVKDDITADVANDQMKRHRIEEIYVGAPMMKIMRSEEDDFYGVEHPEQICSVDPLMVEVKKCPSDDE